MNFDDDVFDVSYLAILVTNLRNSSTLTQHAHPRRTRAYMAELGSLLEETLRLVVGYAPREYRTVKFTGDGFLLLFGEPRDVIRTEAFEAGRRTDGSQATPVVGPARALAVARRLRDRGRQLFAVWNRNLPAGQEPVDVGLVSGIVDGLVGYGDIGQATPIQLDALGEPVVKAFRFAQQRDDALVGGEADRILVCSATRSEVERYLAVVADDGSTVRAQVRDVSFHHVQLTKAPRGVVDPTCHQAVWPHNPTVR